MAGPANRWVAGARPRTLGASVIPVAVGTAVAQAQGSIIWWRAVAALIVSVATQVGTNYANDYSDGKRGTDAVRVGPVRLVASGLASPAAVERAAFVSFGIAAVAGLALASVAGWWLVAVGGLCFAAGWFYTGGPRPYGYAGLGEVFVFVFFGLVGTSGSAYVHLGRLTGLALLAGVPVGLLAVALLVINNLRDIPGDSVAQKNTLAVRLGPSATRIMYLATLVTAFAVVVPIALVRPGALMALGAVVFAVGPARRVAAGESGRSLVEVLIATGRLQVVFGLLLAAGMVL